MMKAKAYFFDMDGVLLNSMPHHALAWEETMQRHGLSFSQREVYVNEGRTGQDVIMECCRKQLGYVPDNETVMELYWEKTAAFHAKGEVQPIAGVAEVLATLQRQGAMIFVVTGSGQNTLLQNLNEIFSSVTSTPYFARERMVTAFDVVHGKPHPEPYLRAWEKSGLRKEECVVIENAPLGVQSAKGAGLFCIAVNTGILTREDLENAGADIVLKDMRELLALITNH